METAIDKGVTFITLAGETCVALESPNEFGEFNALDSDGVEVACNLTFVRGEDE